MNLMNFINRSSMPIPWDEGDNIPWYDPGFSKRMLREHLSQKHDAASRRYEKINKHVRWIHSRLLTEKTTRILDLACGPGLYSSRLAQMGHVCVGIDYSPASIEYARKQAIMESLQCEYICEDIRSAEYGTGFGLVMLIYGEFNIFRPSDAKRILQKACYALNPGGLMLIEPHTFDAIKQLGQKKSLWHSYKHGLFSDNPHLCLEESFWDDTSRTATKRYFIVDALDGNITPYAQTFQAYTNAEYKSIIEESGFYNVTFFSSLTGTEDESQASLIALMAQRL
jgi:SAM-dependent methyltransferase